MEELKKIRADFEQLDELEEKVVFPDSFAPDKTENRNKLIRFYDEELFKSYPDYYDSYLRKANFLCHEKDYSGALQTLELGLSRVQDEALILARARVLHTSGENKKALSLFRELAEEIPFAAYWQAKLEGHTPADEKNTGEHGLETHSLLYQEGVYFRKARLKEQEFTYLQKTITPFEESVIIDPETFQIYPYNETYCLIEIVPEFQEAAEFLYAHLSRRSKLLLHISAPDHNRNLGHPDAHYLRIGYSDRKYVPFEYFGAQLEAFAPLLNDSLFYLAGQQSDLMMEYKIKQGRLTYHEDFAETDDWEDKIDYIESRARSHPEKESFNHFLSMENLCWRHYDLKQYRHLELQKDKVPNEMQKILKSIEFAPDNHHAWYQKSLLHQILEETAKAEECFAKGESLKVNPEYMLPMGVYYLNHSENAKAAATFEKIIQTGQELKTSHLLKGFARLRDKNKIEAQKEFELSLNTRKQLLPFISEYFPLLLEYFDYHKDSREPSQAKLLELDPEHMEAMAKLGDIAEKSGKNDEAIEHYNNYTTTALKNKTNSYAIRTYAGKTINLLNAKASDLIQNGKHYTEAEKCYDKIIELTSTVGYEYANYEGGWVGKSNIKSYQGHHETALKYAEKALEVNGKSAHAWSAKGSSLNNLHRFEEALQSYQQGIEFAPDYYHSYYCKACTLTLTGGDKAEIFKLLEKTLELAPEQKETISREPDFTTLRSDKRFQKLIG